MIDYVTEGLPTEKGVYVCRLIGRPCKASDAFLIWNGRDFYYQGTDARCRCKVIGWLGPLRRNFSQMTEA